MTTTDDVCVGVHIGLGRAVAVMSRSSVETPYVAAAQPTVLYVSATGRATLGLSDDPSAHAFSGFTHLVGNPHGLVDPAGNEYLAADLAASTLTCILREVELSENVDLNEVRTAVTYPPEWTAHAVASMRHSVDGVGLSSTMLVDEEDALTADYFEPREHEVNAARGAALLARRSSDAAPALQDAITDAFPRVTPRRSRMPILAAAGFAAALTLGAVAFAVGQQTSGVTPAVPSIVGGIADSERSNNDAATPTVGPIVFPTVAPLPAESAQVQPAAAPSVQPAPAAVPPAESRPAAVPPAPVATTDVPAATSESVTPTEPPVLPAEPAVVEATTPTSSRGLAAALVQPVDPEFSASSAPIVTPDNPAGQALVAQP